MIFTILATIFTLSFLVFMLAILIDSLRHYQGETWHDIAKGAFVVLYVSGFASALVLIFAP